MAENEINYSKKEQSITQLITLDYSPSNSVKENIL